MKDKEKVTKNMSFAEILEKFPDVAGILMDRGMHCIGCPMSQMESLEDGVRAHGLNPEEIVKEINEKLKIR